MSSRWMILPLLAALLLRPAVADEAMRYIYHRDAASDPARNAYAWRLLETALERTRPLYGDYVLSPNSLIDERPNAASLLRSEGGLSVSVFTPRSEYSGKLIPVRI